MLQSIEQLPIAVSIPDDALLLELPCECLRRCWSSVTERLPRRPMTVSLRASAHLEHAIACFGRGGQVPGYRGLVWEAFPRAVLPLAEAQVRGSPLPPRDRRSPAREGPKAMPTTSELDRGGPLERLAGSDVPEKDVLPPLQPTWCSRNAGCRSTPTAGPSQTVLGPGNRFASGCREGCCVCSSTQQNSDLPRSRVLPRAIAARPVRPPPRSPYAL